MTVQAPLPSLRLDRMKQAKPSARAKAGNNTARTSNQKPPHLPSAPAAQLPHRRGYGFSAIVSDAQPQTVRNHKQKPPSDARPVGPPQPPTQPLTARPPTSKESRRPRSRQVCESPAVKGGSQPMSSAVALKKYIKSLSGYEQGEILDYDQVWTVGHASAKLNTNKNSANKNNYGYDEENGDYIVKLRDHIAFRYEIVAPLGKGSFGQVVKCLDHKNGSCTALKLIRNKKRFHQQALVEVKLLQYLKEHDPHDHANVIHMEEYFYFRNHLCITFEICSMNLYELVQKNNYQGLSLSLIWRFAVQLFTALRALKKLRIIHCDLKPENILLRQANKSGIKIIDFGSSCFEDERVYTYIQSRFYRAPEVILGLPYDAAIDMWSVGCILAELYTGYPIFPGENEMEQMSCIMEVLDQPPSDLIEISSRRKMFFDSKGQARVVTNSRGKKRRPGSQDIASTLHCDDKQFVSFLQGCLMWDPRDRLSPDEAMQHPWLVAGVQPAVPPPPAKGPSRSSKGALYGVPAPPADEKPHSNPPVHKSQRRALPAI